MKHLHILGICGTFMGSLALLAKEMGFKVSGSDQNVYPPMSTQLETAGIEIQQGFDYNPASLDPDLVIVGNVMRRGLPCVEHLLNSNLPFTSGPQWLHDNLLTAKTGGEGRWVLAVAGTHGKTTTASMLAWLLEAAGFNPGFLIGGVPDNFGISARLGSDPFFVIEADEYDTAFFDKRSKFVHYQPKTLVLNNLEFDHADIFADLAAIQTQMHHLMRLLPSSGKVIYPAIDKNLAEVIAMGCYSPAETTAIFEANTSDEAANWQAEILTPDASHFAVRLNGKLLDEVNWQHTGKHNVYNALAALAAARHAGMDVAQLLPSLNDFLGVKRRMELLTQSSAENSKNNIEVYLDFAHHPTAIATTLEGAKPTTQGRLIAVVEPRSNTMQLGSLKSQLVPSLAAADSVFWYQNPNMSWSPSELGLGQNFTCLDTLKAALLAEVKPQDKVIFMSNGSFGGVAQSFAQALEESEGNNVC